MIAAIFLKVPFFGFDLIIDDTRSEVGFCVVLVQDVPARK
jgi:hypothetical protein